MWGWIIFGTVIVLFLVMVGVVDRRRRISSGPGARHELTNYQHIESQSTSVRNQSSFPW